MDVRFALIPARRKQSAASFSPSRATV